VEGYVGQRREVKGLAEWKERKRNEMKRRREKEEERRESGVEHDPMAV
jgi:hypothetical protein